MKSLLSVVNDVNVSLSGVVNDLIDVNDCTELLIELMNLVVEASCVRFVVDKSSFGRFVDIDMRDGVIEEIGDCKSFLSVYRLSPGNVKWKTYFKRFVKFWHRLAIGLYNRDHIFFDDFTMPLLFTFVITLAQSKLRNLRQTSTIVAIEMGNMILKMVDDHKGYVEISKRQLEAELKKIDKDVEVIEELSKSLKMLSRKQESLDDYALDIYEGVIEIRSRDIHPTIRKYCIDSLGKWCIHSPQIWVTKKSLNILGMTLYDISDSVRRSSIDVLNYISAVENTDWRDLMEWFTRRYLNRLLDMPCDKNIALAAESFFVLGRLTRYGYLDDEQILYITNFINDEHLEIREKAANFIHEYYIRNWEGDEQDDDMTDYQVKTLIAVVSELKLKDYPNFVVDSLWDNCTILRKWEPLTQWMLNDTNRAANLTTSERLIWAKILLCSVKKNNLLSEDLRRECAEALSNELPDLIDYFSEDSLILTELIEIPVYLDMWIHSPQLKFKAIVSKIEKSFFHSTNTKLLCVCVDTLIILKQDDVSNFATVTLRNICAQAVSSFSENVQKSLYENENLENLIFCVARLLSLSKKIDLFQMTHADLYSQFLNIICRDIPNKLKKNINVLFYYQIMWDIGTFIDSFSTEFQRKKDMISTWIVELQDTLLISDISLASKSFLILCDLVVLFTKSTGYSYSFPDTLAEDMKMGFEKIIKYYVSKVSKHEEKTRRYHDQTSSEKRNIKVKSLIGSYGSIISCSIFEKSISRYTKTILSFAVDFDEEITDFILSFFKHIYKLRENQNFYDLVLSTLKKKYMDLKSDTENDEDNSNLDQLQSLSRLFSKNIHRPKSETSRSQIIKLLSGCISFVAKNLSERHDFLPVIDEFHSKIDITMAEVLLDYTNETLHSEPPIREITLLLTSLRKITQKKEHLPAPTPEELTNKKRKNTHSQKSTKKQRTN